MKPILVIEQSAAELLVHQTAEIPGPIWEQQSIALEKPGLRCVSYDKCFFVFGPKADAASTLIVFPLQPDGTFENIPSDLRATVLERCLRAALAQPGQHLPRSWAPFQSRSYFLFYSTTLAMGVAGKSLRSIIQKHPLSTNHVLVCAHRDGDDRVDLTAFEASPSAVAALRCATENVGAAVLLQAPIGHGHEFGEFESPAVPTQGRGFTDWLPLLTDDQSKFVRAQISGPTKVRGAAGTGKTLALMLKAVQELYAAVDAKRPWRGLLLTHNWTSAEAIGQSLAAIDERGLIGTPDGEQHLTVRTLQGLATEALNLNTPDVRPLSEDGHEGKTMQLEVIESLVAAFRMGEWTLFKSRCSPHFRERFEALTPATQGRLLCWDLMNEFACVISASRNMTRESYLAHERRKWMMSLPREADREVAWLLHEQFRTLMHEELNALTTYDVINDFLRSLESNAWHLLRKKKGYDLLLVDEFHLFNKQEMLAFQYLSRDANRPPHAVLALDPNQSPSETFLGFKADSHHPLARVFEKTPLNEVRFETVFRYTSQINDLVEVIEKVWFGFDLGSEHEQLKRNCDRSGAIPTLTRVADLSLAINASLARAKKLAATKATTAILCLSASTFEQVVKRIELLERSREAVIITSRDSAEALGPPGRRYIVSQPEYVAGAQYDAVIVLDANQSLARHGIDEQLGLRRLLSALYLGITRARETVAIYSAESEGGPLNVLKPAIEGKQLVGAN